MQTSSKALAAGAYPGALPADVYPGALLVSVRKAGSMLDLGIVKTYELINSRQIDSIKIGKRRLVTVESLQRYVKAALDVESKEELV